MCGGGGGGRVYVEEVEVEVYVLRWYEDGDSGGCMDVWR